MLYGPLPILTTSIARGRNAVELLKALSGYLQPAEQAIFQESEGKREASEERETRAAGKVSLHSSEKRERK